MIDSYIPSYTDISNWNKRKYLNTGGTRAKYVAVNEDGDSYYFKASKETNEGEIRYPNEFWSEIAASKVGKFLGFNLLDYNIAHDEFHKQKIGCFSKSMIDESQERLTEGITFLTGYNANYNPDLDKKMYTFDFIKETLIFHSLETYIENIIEVIIFDSIISNSDRHQENWGFIFYYVDETLPNDKISFDLQPSKDNKKDLLELVKNIFSKNKAIKDETLINIIQSKFSPIYDSGCCLGREINDERIKDYLLDSNKINKYIVKGVSEIHWKGTKVNHFELINNLLVDDYYKFISKIIIRTKDKYDLNGIEEIIKNLDKNIPIEKKDDFFLSSQRKELMIKLITLRLEKLFSLL